MSFLTNLTRYKTNANFTHEYRPGSAGKLNQDIRRSKNALPSTMMPLVSDKTSRIILEHYNSIIYGYCTIVYLAQLHMHVDVLQVSITTITLYYTLN